MNLRTFFSRRAATLAAVIGAVVMSASCGGGTSTTDPFVPERLIVFGDELSTITSAGHKYNVNGLNSSGAIDCTLLNIWVQTLASGYGKVFENCNPNGAAVTAINHAQPTALAAGTGSADFPAQVADQTNNRGGFTSTDLVAVLIGSNDIWTLLDAVEAGSMTLTDAQAELRTRGEAVATSINSIIGQGAKVILVTVPQLGYSPYARDVSTQAGRLDNVKSLVKAFNGGLRTTIVQDGRYIGLVVADDIVSAMNQTPASYALTNTTDAVCTTAAPDCTTSTIVSGATYSAYLWATSKLLGDTAHAQIGSAAYTRARNNPF